jgi:predicted Zn-dependent protease
MIYGENPREGYFQGGVFIHPDLQFLLTFPDGWVTQNARDAVTAISPNRDAIIQLRGATGSAGEAARNFLNQEGVQSGGLSTGSIHGNSAVTAQFTAQTGQQESIRGVVTFIEFGGATWGILGYSVLDRFAAYDAAFLQTRSSFQRLSDPAALAVQPLRVRIDHAPRAMSLQQFNTERCSSIGLAELAVINGLDETAQLRSGQAVKRVRGTPVGTGERSC